MNTKQINSTPQGKPSILASYGLQASVCQFSGVPIAIAANFQHAPRIAGALTLRIHPIFTLPLTELLRAVPSTLKAGSEVEQHLLALALAYQSDFWEFKTPIHTIPEKSYKLLALVQETVTAAIASPVAVSKHGKSALYPKLRITSEMNLGDMVNHLKLIKDVCSTRAPMTPEEKLDWELELEAELNSVLQAGKGYREVYGRNAVQALKDQWVRGQVGECDWKLVAFCLEVTNQPTKDQLLEAIDLLTTYYPERDEFERSEGLQVIRFLERRIEVIQREMQELGFIEVVSVRGAGTVEGMDANYTVRTGEKVVTAEAKPLDADIKKVVEAEWRARGKQFTALELLMETKKRQRAAEAANQVEGV